MARRIEELSPENYTKLLENRKRELDRLIKLKKAIIARSNILENHGTIRVVRHYNKLQFYHITKKGDKLGQYLPREKDDFAISIIKLDYEKKCLKSLQQEQSLIKKLLIFFAKKSVETIFKKLSANKQLLITPVTLSDEKFAKQWESIEYNGKNFDNNIAEYNTAKGERVRSKSEVIIADTLLRMKIPYHYEVPLKLMDRNQLVYPDFCCLNLRNRKVFYWEHFGMMDNPEYSEKAVLKIKMLAENGFYPGKNLILTFETNQNPLNQNIVKSNIENYLK